MTNHDSMMQWKALQKNGKDIYESDGSMFREVLESKSVSHFLLYELDNNGFEIIIAGIDFISKDIIINGDRIKYLMPYDRVINEEIIYYKRKSVSLKDLNPEVVGYGFGVKLETEDNIIKKEFFIDKKYNVYIT